MNMKMSETQTDQHTLLDKRTRSEIFIKNHYYNINNVYSVFFLWFYELEIYIFYNTDGNYWRPIRVLSKNRGQIIDSLKINHSNRSTSGLHLYKYYFGSISRIAHWVHFKTFQNTVAGRERQEWLVVRWNISVQIGSQVRAGQIPRGFLAS